MAPDDSGRIWRCRPLAALTAREVDAIHQARQQVFVVEQACAYLDADGHDVDCLHLTAHAAPDAVPIAYARLLPPGLKYTEASIGRVLTRARMRGTGLGRALVRRAIDATGAAFPGHDVRISAQAHLEGFYATFGFAADKPPHVEDGIPHVEMVLRRVLNPAVSRARAG